LNILIAAIARNGVIGRDGDLPWSIHEDLQRFRALTDGHPVIMGRVTFESIGHPLTGRTNIVLTRNRDYRPDGIEAAASVADAIGIANARHGADSDLYVIGGSAVYHQFMSLADRLELTIVDPSPEGDTWFPQWDPSQWNETASESHSGRPPFEFKTLQRAVVGGGD
jgi:dihydrofolate reductase